MTTTVTIGRDIKGVPMPTIDWLNFREEVRIACQHSLRAIYFKGDGIGWSEEWGHEDAYTIVGEDFPDWGYVSDFYDELRRLGKHYGQEAVAVTQGGTRFI